MVKWRGLKLAYCDGLGLSYVKGDTLREIQSEKREEVSTRV